MINRGGHWGEDVLLLTRRLKRYRGVAMTYLQVFRLARDDLCTLEEADPFSKRLLRRYALVLMLRRYLIDVAERHRAAAATKAMAAAATAAAADATAGDRHAGEDSPSPSALKASPSRRSFLLRSRTLHGAEVSEAIQELDEFSQSSMALGSAFDQPSGNGEQEDDRTDEGDTATNADRPRKAAASAPAPASRDVDHGCSWEHKIEQRQAELASEMAALRADVKELCHMARTSRSMFN